VRCPWVGRWALARSALANLGLLAPPLSTARVGHGPEARGSPMCWI